MLHQSGPAARWRREARLRKARGDRPVAVQRRRGAVFRRGRSGESIKGIARSSGRYELHVAQEPNRWVFDFRDKAGGSGTLTLVLPATISIFEVDPRLGERPGGQGPTLYKEWKLTSNATGTGIFAPGVGSGQRITLILQGHGNSCTSSSDFTHWSIMVSGPKAQYTLFGDLHQ